LLSESSITGTHSLRVGAISGFGSQGERATMRRAMLVGIIAWPVFILQDAFMCFVAYPGAVFWHFILYRGFVEAALAVGYWAAHNDAIRTKTLHFWLRALYVLVAVVISLMATELGGIRSPYVHGLTSLALVWAALMPSSWRHALPVFVGNALSFPTVMLLAALFSEEARAQWSNDEDLIVFQTHYTITLASIALSLVLSHLVWSAQQTACTLGSYQLVDLLGRGGAGEVWRAKHRLLAREAAIKVIRPEDLMGSRELKETVITRFEREAQVTALLNSPHTVALYDFGVSADERLFYVMELLGGLDFKELVQEYGPLPAKPAAYLLIQACDSLSEAHAAGLVHRDIKPSNLHVCRYGRRDDFVKVFDFGLVRRQNTDSADRTSDKIVSGTPNFMAPEQVLNNRPLDARTDLYALGCVAYWLLTGRNVFEGATPMEIMTEHAKATPVPPSQRTDQPIPPEMERLVMACLEKEQASRPRTARVVADALTQIFRDDPWTEDDARQWWETRAQPDYHGERASDSTLTVG
jgi:tRNA A-37 threonylcarbamoyl transferase component Bud32